MLLNKSRTYDFPPKVQFSDKEILEVVSEIKLVGVMISDDLRWTKIAYLPKKLWTLKILKIFRLDTYKCCHYVKQRSPCTLLGVKQVELEDPALSQFLQEEHKKGNVLFTKRLQINVTRITKSVQNKQISKE